MKKIAIRSSRTVNKLIRQGKIRLNGSTPKNPETPVRLGTDRIEVHGHALKAAEKIYLMLNKPRGIITSAADEKGRDTVYSLLPPGKNWLAPVGRLDKAWDQAAERGWKLIDMKDDWRVIFPKEK